MKRLIFSYQDLSQNMDEFNHIQQTAHTNGYVCKDGGNHCILVDKSYIL